MVMTEPGPDFLKRDNVAYVYCCPISYSTMLPVTPFCANLPYNSQDKVLKSIIVYG